MGLVFGGTPPFTVAWTVGGSGAGFVDATKLRTNLSTAGLPAGDVALTLTVTDAASVVASDTVLYRGVVGSVLLSESAELPAGLFGAPAQEIPFTVPAGVARIEATLSWMDKDNDVDFVLLDPNGNEATGNTGRSERFPERATVANPAPGGWTFVVEPFVVVDELAIATVAAWPASDPLPVVDRLDVQYNFGKLDAQTMFLMPRAVKAPYAVAWDFDADGLYETPGTHPAASFAPRSFPYPVAVKVTDADGLEVRRTTLIGVRNDVDHVWRLGCGGFYDRPHATLEHSASGNTCWMHLGHQTYFLGKDGPLVLRGGSAFVRSVEQQQAPPSRVVASVPPAFPVVVETSLDSVTWKEIAVVPYRIVETDSDLGVRQDIRFTMPADADALRFLRFRGPESVTQGLSGFIDLTYGELAFDALPVPLGPIPAPGPREFDCETDLMEAPFENHPCWFGGIDRYDSPSSIHTYFLGDGYSFRNATANATALPWRTDDWFTLVNVPQITTTKLRLQASTDGVAFTEIGSATAIFGTRGTITVSSPTPIEARFLRILPDEHPRFHNGPAPLHHLEGFLVDSELKLS